jgi:hypothetical protein
LGTIMKMYPFDLLVFSCNYTSRVDNAVYKKASKIYLHQA